MKLEGVIVNVHYSDFAAWCIPSARAMFDKLVMVTTPDDTRARKLAEFWHVQTVVSNACYEDGAKFAKGKLINKGLEALDGDGWVVHMDADIFLPPLFRNILEGMEGEMDEEGIYSCDRLMCDSFTDWLRYFTQPVVSNEANIFVHPRPFPVGVRLAKSEFGGWTPLGFFQLWHQGRMRLRYPEYHLDAARGDLQHGKRFPRGRRHFLPEFFVIHIESKNPAGTMGGNWEGRTTPEFGADILYPERFDEAALP